MTVEIAAVPEPKEFMIIDISGGPSAATYPLTYSDTAPAGLIAIW